MKIVYSKRWLPLASSLLLGSAFLNSHLAGLVFVGVLPFIFYVQHAQNLSRKQIWFDCWLAALIFSLIAWCWTLQIRPETWVDLQTSSATYIKTIEWLFIALFSSIGFGFVMGFFVSKNKRQPTRLLVLLPIIWAVGELVRAYSLASLVLGPGSSLSPNWNFGSLGLAVAMTPLVYVSRFVGLHGLTIVAVAIDVAIYLALTKRLKAAGAMIASIILLNLIAWGLYLPNQNQPMKVAAAYLPGSSNILFPWGHLALPGKDTNVLVLPEYSQFFDTPHYKEFAQIAFGPKTTLVTTQKGPGQPATNDLVYYSNQTGFIDRQSKTFLAPFGEYIPYNTNELMKLFGQQKALDTFRRYTEIRRGKQPEHVVHANGITIGGLACSGVLNLNEYRRLSREGADVLTNSASLSLFDKANLYHVQEFYQNRFHAVANARPFVQSSRGGQAYIISSDGKLLMHSGHRSSLIETTVPRQPLRTLYSLL